MKYIVMQINNQINTIRMNDIIEYKWKNYTMQITFIEYK